MCCHALVTCSLFVTFSAAVLASYRGYDTLGEVTVIFTACIGVLMLLGRSRGDYKGIVSREKS